LTGKPSVVQIACASAPGRPSRILLTTSSILAIALPFASWPVITRRTVNAIARLPELLCRWNGTLWGSALCRKSTGFRAGDSMVRLRPEEAKEEEVETEEWAE